MHLPLRCALTHSVPKFLPEVQKTSAADGVSGKGESNSAHRMPMSSRTVKAADSAALMEA